MQPFLLPQCVRTIPQTGEIPQEWQRSSNVSLREPKFILKWRQNTGISSVFRTTKLEERRFGLDANGKWLKLDGALARSQSVTALAAVSGAINATLE